MRRQPKRQDNLRSKIKTQPIAAFASQIVDTIGAPTKLQRETGQKTAAPKSQLRRPLKCRAVGLNEVLIKIPLSLDESITPVLEYAKARFTVPATADGSFLVTGQVKPVNQLAGK